MTTASKAASCTVGKKACGFRPLEATRLLEADHAEIGQLFEQYQQLVDDRADDDQRRALTEQICTLLVVHAAIEEEIFYPAARKASDEHEVLDEAEVGNELARVLIAKILEMDPGDALYDARVKVLGEHIDHHVQREEGELFAKCKSVGMDLQALGAELADRKQALLSGTTRAASDVFSEVARSTPQRGRHRRSSLYLSSAVFGATHAPCAHLRASMPRGGSGCVRRSENST
jgi:hemerythrin superfamily protein